MNLEQAKVILKQGTKRMNKEKEDYIKIKNFCSLKDTMKRVKRQVKRYLPYIYSSKDSYPEHTKMSYKPTRKKTETQQKNRQNP